MICFRSAREILHLIHSRQVSVREVVAAHLEQIERVNPAVNAICTLAAEEALDEAESADRRFPRGGEAPPLYGLPVAIKDLVLTRGMRTTFGSRIYRDFVPEEDALHVARLKEAGAIVIGKTNTPEFGAGSQTFNEVFGETRNPYDPSKTCGGSSGGAAVALACGMVPLADGTDLGGSLRNPASFCNVVGLRTAPGRVPLWPSRLGWQTLSVAGPMARTVEDAALMLSVMAGPDPRSPIAIDEPGGTFEGALDRSFRGARIAWTPDLGRYPVESAVVEVCRGSLRVFEDMGAAIEETHPDLQDADEIFQTLRGFLFAAEHRDDIELYRPLMKDTVVWNVERGLALDALSVARAEERRTALYHRVRSFFDRREFLILPVAQVAPFPIERRWVEEIEGVQMKTYIDWMASCYAISITGLPAISVPCGFTPAGLPVGLQIVGRHRQERAVLELAYAFQQATRVGERRPAIASGSSAPAI